MCAVDRRAARWRGRVETGAETGASRIFLLVKKSERPEGFTLLKRRSGPQRLAVRLTQRGQPPMEAEAAPKLARCCGQLRSRGENSSAQCYLRLAVFLAHNSQYANRYTYGWHYFISYFEVIFLLRFTPLNINLP